MKVRFRKIYLGRVVGEMVKEYDGDYEANKQEIMDDSHDGYDPGELILAGDRPFWIEATPL